MENLEIIFNPFPDEALSRLLSDHVAGFNHVMTGVADGIPSASSSRAPAVSGLAA